MMYDYEDILKLFIVFEGSLLLVERVGRVCGFFFLFVGFVIVIDVGVFVENNVVYIVLGIGLGVFLIDLNIGSEEKVVIK